MRFIYAFPVLLWLTNDEQLFASRSFDGQWEEAPRQPQDQEQAPALEDEVASPQWESEEAVA
jgi:hypothetical protein